MQNQSELISTFKKACENNNIVELRKILAAANGDSELLKTILTANESCGFTLACQKGHAEIINRILDEVNGNSELLKTILTGGGFIGACHKGHAEIINRILDAANGNSELLKTILTARGFIGACHKGHAEVVNIILNEVKILDAANGNSELLETILTTHQTGGYRWACENGHAEVVNIILNEVKILDAANGNSELLKTILTGGGFIGACHKGHAEIINRILDAANGNSELLKTILTARGFIGACHKGHAEVVNIILNEVKILDAANGNSELLEKILTADNAYGFRWACQKGHAEIINRILDAANGNSELLKTILTANESYGFTWACQKDHAEIINRILDAANGNSELLKTILTANESCGFTWACENGHAEIINRILDAANGNSELLKTILTANESCGFTWACENGHAEIVNRILDAANGNSELLKTILTARGFIGACHKGHAEIINRILDAANGNSELLKTILTARGFIGACQKGHAEVVNIILNEVKILDAANGNSELLEKILTADNAYGFKRACNNGHAAIVNFILKAAESNFDLFNNLFITNFRSIPESIRSSYKEKKASQSIYLAPMFYKDMEATDKASFLLKCSQDVQDIINICFNTLNWTEITKDQARTANIFNNINKLKEFDNILNDAEMRMIIKNARKGKNMGLLFSHNSILSWAINHADEVIDKKTIKSDLHKVINPWLHEVSLPAYNTQGDFQEKAYLTLQYLIHVMKSPTIWFRIKNWFLQACANIGLINKDNILKSDQEYFKILLRKYKSTFGPNNVTDCIAKIEELRVFASGNRFAWQEINRVSPPTQNNAQDNLRWIANNRESAMRALTELEESNIKSLKQKYPIANALKIIEDLKKAIQNRYEKNPITLNDGKTKLPLTFAEFNKMELTNAQKQEALIAYYKDINHCAYRYLLDTNDWRATNSWPESYKKFLDYIALFYTAAIDRNALPKNVDAKDTKKVDEFIKNRFGMFLLQLKELVRAHNYDKYGDKDDLHADQPSCQGGTLRRILQSLVDHPDYTPVNYEDIINHTKLLMTEIISKKLDRWSLEKTKIAKKTYKEEYAKFLVYLEEPSAEVINFFKELDLNDSDKENIITRLSQKFGSSAFAPFRGNIEELLKKEEKEETFASLDVNRFSYLFNLNKILKEIFVKKLPIISYGLFSVKKQDCPIYTPRGTFKIT